VDGTALLALCTISVLAADGDCQSVVDDDDDDDEC